MKSSLCSLVGAIVMSLAIPLVLAAEDGGWKMPNLNPFSSSGQTGSGQPPTSGWKMPKLLPSTTAKARPKRKSNQPTTWNKMTNDTQQFFSKTADTLNPWDNKKPAPRQNLTGSNTAFTHNNAAKKVSTSSGAVAPASWFSSDKGGQRATSVSDFLSQPRPQ
jgi:hypothetical protein